MKIQFRPEQPSTQRGLIWIVFGIIGMLFAWFDKDTNQLLAVFTAMSAAGAHGLFVDDNQDKK